MADDENKTYADSELTAFFRDYFMFHKANPSKRLGITDIQMAFYSALSGLDNSFSSREFILAMKKDFEVISKQLEHLARDAQNDIAQDGGKWDKYSETERSYFPREIAAEWDITASAIRYAISHCNLEATEVKGKKDKYLVKEKDWLEYATSHHIKKRSLQNQYDIEPWPTRWPWFCVTSLIFCELAIHLFTTRVCKKFWGPICSIPLGTVLS